MASKRPQYPYCVQPGRLRHRVTIETAATPTSGEPNPTYTNFAGNIAAEVIETSGGEYVRGRQIEAGVSAMVAIRWRDDITPRMRVRYGTRYWNIESVVDPTGHRSELLLKCTEVQP